MDRLKYHNQPIFFHSASASLPTPIRTPEEEERIKVNLTVGTLIAVTVIIGSILSFHYDPLQVFIIAIISLTGTLLLFFIYRCCCVSVVNNSDNSDNSAHIDSAVVTRRQQLSRPLLSDVHVGVNVGANISPPPSPPLRVTMDILTI